MVLLTTITPVWGEDIILPDLVCNACPLAGGYSANRPPTELTDNEETTGEKAIGLLERLQDNKTSILSVDFQNGIKIRDNSILFAVGNFADGRLNLTPSKIKLKFLQGGNKRIELSARSNKVYLKFELNF